MPDATITYKSKEAGQQISGATYLNGADDGEANTILGIITQFQMPNAWNALNAVDGHIDGDGSSIANSKEVIGTFQCADGTLSTIHVPFVQLSKGEQDLQAAVGIGVGGGGSELVNEAGSPFQKLLRYKEINFR